LAESLNSEALILRLRRDRLQSARVSCSLEQFGWYGMDYRCKVYPNPYFCIQLTTSREGILVGLNTSTKIKLIQYRTNINGRSTNLQLLLFKVLDALTFVTTFTAQFLLTRDGSHLAVGLGALLYAWSEMQGVHLLNGGTAMGPWLTSLAFSSTQAANVSLRLVGLMDRST